MNQSKLDEILKDVQGMEVKPKIVETHDSLKQTKGDLNKILITGQSHKIV